MTKSDTYDVPALRKSLRIIELLCSEEDPLSAADISKRLGISSNMVFRVLKTLTNEGWVSQSTEGPRYSITLKFYEHAAKPLNRLDLVKAARGPMEELWNETGENCFISRREGARFMHLLHFNGTRPIRLSVTPGVLFKMHTSAPGKILMAHAGKSVEDQVIEDGLDQQTPHSITSATTLRKELATIRKQGYALDVEETLEGLYCYAAPVRNHTGSVIGAVGISVLTLYATLDEIVTRFGPRVQARAAEISGILGFNGNASLLP